jgi:phage tail sheath protein FI
MATAYKTPGVFIEEIPRFPPSIAPVETAIPAFIGYTQKAEDITAGDLHLKPKRISSLVEYEKFFGLAQNETAVAITITVAPDGSIKRTATLAEDKRSKHIMYYALQMFFANGGGPCWIVSVNPYKANVADPLVQSELIAGLAAVKKEDEPTLIVFPEAQNLATSADFGALVDAARDQCAELKDRFVIMDVHGGDDGARSLSNAGTNLLDAVGNFRSKIGANNLKYGAAYAPNIETILDVAFDENATDVVVGANAAVKLNTLKASDNQAYELAKAAVRDMSLKLPPSAAMAGIYAAIDNSRGVWKAPANVSVNAVVAPTIQFTNVEQDQLNVDPVAGKSVNAVRPFIGKGTLVWGARTLAGNDNEWRYINVRRLFIFVEESVKKATEQFVFEANDANTWVKVQGMIENFLTTLWRQGALQGVKPEHAFYAAVGLGKTMTALDILEGRMIVEIGMAAVRPAEFIILRFSHKMPES